jgi:hypothetical protein
VLKRLDSATVARIEAFVGSAHWREGSDSAFDPFFLVSQDLRSLFQSDLCSLFAQQMLLGLIPCSRDLDLDGLLQLVRARFIAKPVDLARLAQLLLAVQEGLRASRTSLRAALGHEERGTLLDRAQSRCSICRCRFSDAAVEAFYAGRGFRPNPVYQYYDWLKPARIRGREQGIEVDHIQPISFTGSDELENLQVLCAYCNRVKRDYFTIYDRLSEIIRGDSCAPHPFGVLRLLSRDQCRRCYTEASSDDELTVRLRDRELPPLLENLEVTCYAHDDMGDRWLVIPPC